MRWPIARTIPPPVFESRFCLGRRRFQPAGRYLVEKVILEQYNKRQQIILDSTPQDVEVDISKWMASSMCCKPDAIIIGMR